MLICFDEIPGCLWKKTESEEENESPYELYGYGDAICRRIGDTSSKVVDQ